MSTIGVYKIISPSEYIYIGQSIHIERRFKEYESLNCKSQRKIYNSLIKYGIKAHNFSIIKKCAPEELNKWERFYQLFYKNAGYELMNLKITSDGDKSGYLSEETKKRISESKKGKGRKILMMERGTDEVLREATIDIFIKDGFDKTCISKACSKKIMYYKGYEWKYKSV